MVYLRAKICCSEYTRNVHRVARARAHAHAHAMGGNGTGFYCCVLVMHCNQDDQQDRQ